MRAAGFTDYGEPLEIIDVDAPDPDPDGVVVETEACGICRSDWHAWTGDWTWRGVEPDPGHVFGHEPAGTVVAVGADVETVREGDHVAVPFNLGDGTCRLCRTDRSNVCENRLSLGFSEEAPGAWAEEVHVPVADHNAVHLPEGVSSVDMAGLGCRFMTSFRALAHRADVAPGDWVAVHGCGGVGLSAVQIADALGANVVAVDLNEETLDVAEELGADETVDASGTDDVPGAVAAVAGRPADVAVDALGIEATCRNALHSLGTTGTHVQIGLTTGAESGEVTLPVDRMVLEEITFVGSNGMQPSRYDEIFRMTATGKLAPEKVISETVGLGDVSETLAAMTDFDTVGIRVIDDFSA